MKLFDAPASNPMIVRFFVLERGGISLDIETIDVMNMEIRGLEYRKINPRGEVSALALDNGFALNEVTATCEYFDEIAQRGKSLLGETPIELAETRMWLRRMDLGIAQPVIFWVRNDPGTADLYIGHRIPIPEARLAQKATIQQYLNLLDEQLEGKKYICGERFSAADIHFYSLMKGKTSGMAPWILHPGRKNVVRCFERMDAREASKKGLEVFRARVEAQWTSMMKRPRMDAHTSQGRVDREYLHHPKSDHLIDRTMNNQYEKTRDVLGTACDSVSRGG
ncbi:glutathione S-transferase GST [Fusarium coicis]|nr:glutathione S-transferase GST [Fusarium coicis]